MTTAEVGSLTQEQVENFISQNSICYAGYNGPQFATDVFPDLIQIVTVDKKGTQDYRIQDSYPLECGANMRLLDQRVWSEYKVSTVELTYPDNPQMKHLVDIMADELGNTRFFDRITQNGPVPEDVKGYLAFRFGGHHPEMGAIHMLRLFHHTELNQMQEEFKPNWGKDYYFNKPLLQKFSFKSYGQDIEGHLIGLDRHLNPVVHTEQGTTISISRDAQASISNKDYPQYTAQEQTNYQNLLKICATHYRKFIREERINFFLDDYGDLRTLGMSAQRVNGNYNFQIKSEPKNGDTQPFSVNLLIDLPHKFHSLISPANGVIRIEAQK